MRKRLKNKATKPKARRRNVPKARQPELTPQEIFDALYSQRMSELGRAGGKIGGKRRLETMTEEARSQQALAAVRARWARVKAKQAATPPDTSRPRS